MRHKILWDCEIRTPPPIQVRKPDLVLISKKKQPKNFPSSGFCRSSGPQSKNERKQKTRQIAES